MIIPIYQPLGSSTHLLAQKVGEMHTSKATHTGTLDPMAEGVVVVLTDEDRFLKSTLSDWKKTYEFKIIWGVSTDTHDLLGVIEKDNLAKQPDLNMLQDALTSFIGQQLQEIPTFSAKRNPDTQFSNITIFDLSHTNTQLLSAKEIVQQLNLVIPKLKNDFRQELVLQGWNNWFKTLPNQEDTQLLLTTHTATTSKRTYIRGLVRDLSTKINLPATTFHINRTANGSYTSKDCTCLV
jgi:tRNA pseudouridine(55) synthase